MSDTSKAKVKPTYKNAIRDVLAFVWAIACCAAQWAFDRPDSPIIIRLAAIAVVVIPVVIIVVLARRWLRGADEYQKMLYRRAAYYGAVYAIGAGIIGHWLEILMHWNMWPVMALPAWMISGALTYQRMLASQYEK